MWHLFTKTSWQNRHPC